MPPPQVEIEITANGTTTKIVVPLHGLALSEASPGDAASNSVQPERLQGWVDRFVSIGQLLLKSLGF